MAQNWRLWTYQSVGHLITGPIDPTNGYFWNAEDYLPRYREAENFIFEKFNTNQFLWCCTVSDCWPITNYQEYCEWELNVPESQILAFIRESIWDPILRGEPENLENVFVTGRPIIPHRDISALVKAPPSPKWIKCHGKLVSKEWREEAEMLMTADTKKRRYCIKWHRDRGGDKCANYLEEYLKLGKPPGCP